MPRKINTLEKAYGLTKKIEYYEIAAVQIDRAIQLYFEKDYICALTLAGAGEEILGKLLKSENKKTSLEDLVKKLHQQFPEYSERQIADNLNLSRNALKHLLEEVFDTDIEIKQAADAMIMRGILNYVELRNFKTKFMTDFVEQNH